MHLDYKLMLQRPITAKIMGISIGLLLLIQMIEGIVSYRSLDDMSEANHLQTNQTKHTRSLNTGAGLTTNFFGDYVPKNIIDGNIRQSMLDLTVVGIVFSTDERESYVILRAAAGRERTFKVGDNVPGGAMIKRITADGVLVLRNGVLERLSLPKNELIFEPPSRPLNHAQ